MPNHNEIRYHQAMEIRPLRSDDLPEVAHLVSLAYSDILLRLHGEAALAAYQPRTAAMLETLRALGPGFCFVGEEAGRLTGAIFGRAWGSLGWFSSLAILPELQGLGFGRALATASIDSLRAAGCRTIGLETWPAAAAYTAMYVGLGFRPVGLCTQIYAPVDLNWPDPPAGRRVRATDDLPAPLRSGRLAAAGAICHRLFEGFSLEVEIAHAESDPAAHALWLVRDGAIVGLAICDTSPDYDVDGRHADLRAAVLDPDLTGGADFLALAAAAAKLAAAAGRHYLDVDAPTEYVEAYRYLLEAGFRAGGQLLRFIATDAPYPAGSGRLVYNVGRWST